MVLQLGVLVLVAAAPKFAVAPLNCPGSDASRAEFFTEHLADRLGDEGLDITSPRETTTVLGIERQRQLMGCGDSSCLIELAGALGAAAVVVGDVAQLGATWQVNLKVIDARSAKRIAAYSASASAPEAIPDRLTAAARDLAAQLATTYQLQLTRIARASPVVPTVVATSPGVARFWWIPAAVVLAGGVLAAFEFSYAEDRRRVLIDTANLSAAQAQSAFELGVEARTVGWVGVGVGAAAAGTLAAMVLFGRDAPLTPSVSLGPNRVGLVLGGHF